MKEITVVTNGETIVHTQVLDAEDQQLLRVQEVHVIFEVGETVPHGYFVQHVLNDDGNPQLAEDGEGFITRTVDVERIHIRQQEVVNEVV